MPRPTTGQFRQPGASQAGFISPLNTRDLGAQLDELAHNAQARRSEHAVRALQALNGTDPTLYPIASTVRPRVMAMLQRHAQQMAARRASPERAFLNPEGLKRFDQDVLEQHQKEFSDLEAKITAELETVMASLQAKLGTLRGNGVTDEEMNEVTALAGRLRLLSPEIGLGEIIEFFDQVGVGERSRAELIALLPVLESAYQTPGSPWSGRDELRRLMAIGESLSDGGWQASVLEARLERSQKLAAEIATFIYLAKTDPTSSVLNAHVTGGADPDRAHGDYALLPELLPPDGPAVELKEDWRTTEPKPFRRIAAGTISSEQRAADQAARAE